MPRKSKRVEAEPRVLTIPKIVIRPPEDAKPDIPFSLILLVGVLIWVLVFGTIFSFAAAYPCNFVTLVIGERKTLDTLSERLNLDFTQDQDCRQFMRFTMVTPGFISAGTG